MKTLLAKIVCIGLILSVISGCGEVKKRETPKAESAVGVPICKGEAEREKEVKPPAITRKEQGTPFAQIKIRNWDDGRKKIEVNDRSDNVVVEKIEDGIVEKKPTTKNNNRTTPPDCMASVIADRPHEILWQPWWRYENTGGPSLEDIQISPDKSVLAVLETTGEATGPYGSRIVFINTYTWDILRIIELEKKYIRKIRFVPESNLLVCWEDRQKVLKQPYKLLTLDCKSGETLATSTAVKSSISDMIIGKDGAKLFVKTAKKTSLFVFKFPSLELIPQKINSMNSGGVLALSEDGKLLLIAGKKSFEFIDANTFRPVSSFTPPKGFDPELALFAGGTRKLAVIGSGGEALFFKNGRSIPISSTAGAVLCFDKLENSLLVGIEKNSYLQIVSLPYLEESTIVKIGKLRPRTRAPAIFASPLYDRNRVVVFDKQGNLYVLYKKKGKKWKKELILTAKR